MYRYSTSNCNENEIPPALISSKLDICFNSIKYSCSSNTSTTTEILYRNDNCKDQDKQISFDNNVCSENSIMNCTFDQVPSLPSKSYIAAIYSNEVETCNDDTQIRQINSIPLGTCTYGYIYRCNSTTLTIEKYQDVKCSTFINKLNQKLGCVHNNPIYKVIRNFCT